MKPKRQKLEPENVSTVDQLIFDGLLISREFGSTKLKDNLEEHSAYCCPCGKEEETKCDHPLHDFMMIVSNNCMASLVNEANDDETPNVKLTQRTKKYPKQEEEMLHIGGMIPSCMFIYI